ncbi:hypothetical protein PPL_00411 [Heterostelium album PN500]|uniref:EGF-like domain-containing protein n=1 Tax=Heterostelium pallidum (strain ATCC 26659 / Pp 5 / PN500) TaxID=670386 RepID=D3AWD7_HETP5|nr:hypothetical protein PPL_00411 [Heterostelium album PN500]EFA86610.1 hypothetical protein PPL_00411 [Heterostelium album PN500]|eukprot:XP_020438715.1 hypothetical protein PPL_00411 [Heterostelium album PN500]
MNASFGTKRVVQCEVVFVCNCIVHQHPKMKLILIGHQNFAVITFCDESLKPHKGYWAPVIRPYFIAPTPNDEAVIKCPVGQTTTWTYKATTKNPKDDVYIFSVNRPHGLDISKQNGTNPAVVNVSWKPKSNQIGTYKLLVAVTNIDFVLFWDTLSITLVVEPQPCGNGAPRKGCNPKKENCCQCDPGWDPASSCYECLPGYFGNNCDPDPPCVNGIVNSGRTGNGQCVCNFGWTGASCDIQLPPRCDPNAKSRIVTSTSSPYNYLNPYDLLIYLEPNNPNLQVPLQLSQYSQIPKIDIYLLVDTNVKQWRCSEDLIAYVDHLMFKFAVYNKNTKFGLGLFSDSPTKGFNFEHKYAIGSMVKRAFRKETFTSSSTSTGNSLIALSLASNATVGWRASSYRSIVVITDNDCAALTNSLVATTHSNLVENYIMPTVISMGSDVPNWNQFVQANGFGVTDKTTVFGIDWVIRGYHSILNSFRQVSPEIVGDSRSFLPSLPSNFQIPWYSTKPITIPINLQLPAQVSSPADVEFDISLPGYGKSHFHIQFNSPPVAAPLTFTETTFDPITFTLPVSDPDQDTLLVQFQLPIQGILFDSNNNSIDPTAFYPATTQFVLYPLHQVNFTVTIGYSVNDGCTTVSSYIQVDIINTNTGPVANPLHFDAMNYADISFVLPVSDPDNNPLQVRFNAPTDGMIFIGNQTITDDLYYPASTQFTLKWSAPLTTVEFQYQCTDGQSTATSVVSVLLINRPPEAAPVVLTATTTDELSFTLPVSDPDLNPMSVSFTSIPVFASIELIDGTRVVENVLYPSASTFVYTPSFSNPSMYATYSVTDGYLSASSYVNITLLETPPVAPFVNLTVPGVDNHYDFTIGVSNANPNDVLSIKFSGLSTQGFIATRNGAPIVEGTYYQTNLFTFVATNNVVYSGFYTVSNGQFESSNNLAVLFENLPPVGQPIDIITENLQPKLFTIQASDPENDPVYYEIDPPVNGTLRVYNGAVITTTFAFTGAKDFEYTPNQESDYFAYRYKDAYHPFTDSYVRFRQSQPPVAPYLYFERQNYDPFNFTIPAYSPVFPASELIIQIVIIQPMAPLYANGQLVDYTSNYTTSTVFTLHPIEQTGAIVYSAFDGIGSTYGPINYTMTNLPPSTSNSNYQRYDLQPFALSFQNNAQSPRGHSLFIYKFVNSANANYRLVTANNNQTVDPNGNYSINTQFNFMPTGVWGTALIEGYVTDNYLQAPTPFVINVTFANPPPMGVNYSTSWPSKDPMTIYIPSYDTEPYTFVFNSIPQDVDGFKLVYENTGQYVPVGQPVDPMSMYTAYPGTLKKLVLLYTLADQYYSNVYSYTVIFAANQ